MSDNRSRNSTPGATMLTPVLEAAGPWTYAYVDGAGAEPQAEQSAREASVQRRLAEMGAPDESVEAIARALESPTGLAAPSARYLLARGDAVELDVPLPGARVGTDVVGFGAVPPVLPVLRHLGGEISYLLVEAGRDGSRLRRETAGRRAQSVEEVGDGEALSKVQAGGMSQARYQRSAEESWKANQREAAEAVDRIVREDGPAFVVVAGDVRARQLLIDDLSEESLRLVTEVDVHTRPRGADDDALEAAVADEVDAQRGDVISEVRGRAAAGGGQRGATGVAAVMAALQQAQVDTLLLDARWLGADGMLDALATAPWVDDGDTLSVGTLGRVPAAEALARAALLTDAGVLVEEEEPEADDAPRSDREPREPLALLRWAEE